MAMLCFHCYSQCREYCECVVERVFDDVVTMWDTDSVVDSLQYADSDVSTDDDVNNDESDQEFDDELVAVDTWGREVVYNDNHQEPFYMVTYIVVNGAREIGHWEPGPYDGMYGDRVFVADWDARG